MFHLERPPFPASRGPRGAHTLLHVALLGTAALASVATSKRREPTHDPVYLSWERFRQSGTVEKPRAIHRNGKLLVAGSMLLVSEPNLGIHVIDNTDPRAPRPTAFIALPGNQDLALRGQHLYADSFVDLVVFEVRGSRPEEIRKVGRVNQVFPYDPYQTLEPKQYVETARVEQELGVVVGWKPRPGREP